MRGVDYKSASGDEEICEGMHCRLSGRPFKVSLCDFYFVDKWIFLIEAVCM